MKTSERDVENGNFQISFEYDHLGRLTQRSEGGLRYITTAYDDAGRKLTVKADLRGANQGELQTVTHFDQLGRVRLIRKNDGAFGLNPAGESDGIKTQRLYKFAASGRVELESNPYRQTSDPTMGWTCREYDRNGRLRWLAHFAGAGAPNSCQEIPNRTDVSQTIYDGDETRSIDAAGNQWKYTRDSMGRIYYAVEPTVL